MAKLSIDLLEIVLILIDFMRLKKYGNVFDSILNWNLIIFIELISSIRKCCSRYLSIAIWMLDNACDMFGCYRQSPFMEMWRSFNCVQCIQKPARKRINKQIIFDISNTCHAILKRRFDAHIFHCMLGAPPTP